MEDSHFARRARPSVSVMGIIFLICLIGVRCDCRRDRDDRPGRVVPKPGKVPEPETKPKVSKDE